MEPVKFAISTQDLDLELEKVQAQLREKHSAKEAIERDIDGLKQRITVIFEVKKMVQTIGIPVQSNRFNRRDQLVQFLIKNGPQHRKTIIEKTGIPEGTVAAEMRDKETFSDVGSGHWDVTAEVKRRTQAIARMESDAEVNDMADE